MSRPSKSTATPNQMLQRTAPRVTARAAARHHPSTHRHAPRCAPQSLSLGAFGVAMSSLLSVFIFLEVAAFGVTPTSSGPPLSSPPPAKVSHRAEQKDRDYTPAYITAVVALIVGFGAGRYGHSLTRSRDREARQHTETTARAERIRQFEAFLLRWEQTAERTPAHATPSLYFGQAAEQFRSEAGKVRNDFRDRLAEFDRLDAALSRMTPEVLADDPANTSRDKLASAIRNFLQFVRNA